MENKIIRGAVIGYGPVCGMGQYHAASLNTDRFKLIAVCDIDPERTEVAKEDFPHINTYNHIDDMLDNEDFDLISVVLPHNLHAPITIKCLKAGKNG